MNEGLRQAMLGRMKSLNVNIKALNTTADELVRSAFLLDGQPLAQTLLGQARLRRVQVLAMQGRLAALRERYDTRFSTEPEGEAAPGSYRPGAVLRPRQPETGAAMRLEMLSYLNTLDKGIIALELMADELVRAAELARDEVAANIMLTVARGHQVKIVEMQGQFAALKEVYSERYHCEA